MNPALKRAAEQQHFHLMKSGQVASAERSITLAASLWGWCDALEVDFVEPEIIIGDVELDVGENAL
jgi:hypothetical protein